MNQLRKGGAVLGGRNSWKGSEGVLSPDDRLGVFVSCGWRVMLPGMSSPRLLMLGVVGVDNPSTPLENGFSGFFYYVKMQQLSPRQSAP